MSFGLSRNGFKRKRYADVFSESERRAKEMFGEDINTAAWTPVGIILRIHSFTVAQLWQETENSYNSGFVHKSEGKTLSGVAMNQLVRRRPAEFASGVLNFTGDEGTEIPEGSLFSNDDGVTYRLAERVVISEDTTDGTVVALEAGALSNSPANTVTEIDTPVAGLDEVTNLQAIAGGRDEETDGELRDRYDRSLTSGGSPTTNGIRAAVLSVEGVRTATVIDNTTNESVNGRPPKSFETYVLGGESEDIAREIFRRRAAGIEAHGDELVEIEDDSGNIVPIKFSRAEEVQLDIEVDITVNNEYPSNGHELVRSAIIEYIGGTDEDGNIYTGLQTGQDVVYSRLISIVHRVPGVASVDSLTLNGESGNISIDAIQVAQTNYEQVVVS
ncbi:baseplate J/gp47 family protein [Geomicrobium sediminis]|uniref:Phage protein gp47/JayE n=1 Tax=Geomicrobium sediminis TaxID=1347788 RepID=A0ABS2PGJ9_9BACL|nr:baseplate J/gp47 family protein [Geomicrobium sediminis]MBM7634086.1 putative phage protein gp47/JayE [Geomicrobium sediminis]